MPCWFDQDVPDPMLAAFERGGYIERVGESAQPCGCDPGCKPTPHVCTFHVVQEEALDILEAIIYASDSCAGHRDCNHTMEPWQRARAFLHAHKWKEEDHG